MTNASVNISDGLVHLIEANQPFWGGEAEVIRTYWNSPCRSVETDKKWVIHQIYKEYWDGILPPLASFTEQLPDASVAAGRARLLEIAEVLHEEVEHFALFADLFVEVAGSDYALTPEQLKEQGAWPENATLMQLRAEHRTMSPELGRRAYHLTEGGYCTLFSEGMKIDGRSVFDSAVAEVCRQIYADEFNHMLLGMVNASAQLSSADWELLTEFTVAQLKKRILMRQAQFSQPVTQERLQVLLAGGATPIEFDFDRAGALLKQSGG